MRKGRVDWFDTARGFGFVQPSDGGPDLFVHQNTLIAAGIYEVREGDAVAFLERVGRSSGKPQASFVRC
jgi:CspA family cold shock protein